MDRPYTNRLIAINDMLNSPIQVIRNEGIRLFYELWFDFTTDQDFTEETSNRIQKIELLIQVLKEQYPEDIKLITTLQESLGISSEALDNFTQSHQPEIYKRFYILNDQVSGLDYLNYDKFASAFTELILNPEMPTPITIGIYGHWGKGKSFLMQKTLEKTKTSLNEINSKKSFWETKQKNVFIEFNAWSYSNSDHLWAGMVTHVYTEVEKHLGWRVPWHRFIKAVHKSWRKALSLSLFYILIGFGVNILIEFNEIIGALENIQIVVSSIGASIIGGSVVASLPILWSSLREFTDTLFLSRAKNLQLLASRPDFHDQIGVMADIKEEINFISDTLKRNSSRMIMFIDDLDRCDHKKAVEVLQAIMLLLTHKDGLPFMIFLGIDARVIVRAIEENYGTILVGAGITGYEFLDKIIQLPFVIPPTDPSDMQNYIESLLWASEEEKGRVFQSDIAQNFDKSIDSTETNQSEPDESEEKTPVTFSKTERVTIMKWVNDFCDNPRKIKRIMNMLRLVKLVTRGKNLDFEKMLRWVTMVEQWPLHTAWILHEVENDLQKKQIKPEVLLSSVYQNVKDYIHSDGMSNLFSIDQDPTLFENFIEKEPGSFKVLDILNFLPLTFNLNPAIRWDVENYANRVIELQKAKVPTPENNPA